MRYFPLMVCLLGAGAAQAEPVTLTGAIGPYGIEMELDRSEAALNGRYRYEGREVWLGLTGEAFGNDAFQLAEWNEGSETGVFYLDVTEDGLVGFWAGAGTDYPVELQAVAPIGELLDQPKAPELGPQITGQYFAGGHWVNDWFAPQYEIGFNGGTVDVVQIAPGQIYVAFDFVVGPTYHIASFRGLAKETTPGTYVHNAVLEGGSGPCHLEFIFEPGALDVIDTDNGFACQFGARAHANFYLNKVSDTAEFGGFW